MSLLAFEVHDDVAGLHDLLEKFKDFALAQGWTVDRFEQNKDWQDIGGGVHDFAAGTESFLEISSSGFGSQNLHFRFRAEASGAVANQEWLQTGAFLGVKTYDSTSAIHPVQRDGAGTANWNSFRFASLTPNTIPQVWFFGNDKFLFCVCKMNSTFVVYPIWVGSVEVTDTSETQAYHHGFTISVTNPISTHYWFNENLYYPGDLQTYSNIYHDNEAVANFTEVKKNFTIRLPPLTAIPTHSAFDTYGELVTKQNGFSDRRPKAKQIIYRRDNNDLLWFELGELWIYRMRIDGFQIGEERIFGSEKYLVFPNGTLNSDIGNHGIAVRIQ